MDLLKITDIDSYGVASVATDTDGERFIFMLSSERMYLPDIRAIVRVTETPDGYTPLAFVDSMSVESSVSPSMQDRVEGECFGVIKQIYKMEAENEEAKALERKAFNPEL